MRKARRKFWPLKKEEEARKMRHLLTEKCRDGLLIGAHRKGKEKEDVGYEGVYWR